MSSKYLYSSDECFGLIMWHYDWWWL